jgi:A/G-specific adenine glycosylase
MEPLNALPQLLLPWFAENRRDLPWRRDREPYHVWLSEIMLQQTRVEAVKQYYIRFLEKLPDIPALAQAEETELLKLWEGLGYYSRVRNLQKAAKVIMADHGGTFPEDFASIRALPGIGDYTAGAIASICFDQKTPAVDGNVLRVLSRFLDDHSCTDDLKVKRRFSAQLAEIYPEEAGTFTQALMELGAMVCVPNGQARCGLCPLENLCRARENHTIDELPVRAEKKPRKQQDMTVFLLTCGEEVALKKRPDAGLLAGLYEFPNVPGTLSAQDAIAQAEVWGLHPQDLEKAVGRRHIFTHIQWNMTGVRLRCGSKNPAFLWADRATVLGEMALPTAFRQFLPDIWEDIT